MTTARVRSAAAAGVLAAALCAASCGGPGTPVRHATRMQLGLDSFVTYQCEGLGTYEQFATTQVHDDRSLGANSIALAFPLYMASLTSNEVAAKLLCGKNTAYQSPPVAVLSAIVAIAHRAGLAVLLRPLVALPRPARGPRGWRGAIEPVDLRAWFAHYWTAIRPYLVMAQADHVERVAIASELDSIADAPQWTSLIARAKRIYGGDLVFDYSWNTPKPKSWKPGTSSAVDAYPNLHDVSSSQTPAQLVSAWNHLLTTDADYEIPGLSDVSIDEVGIPAQVGAYLDPSASAFAPSTHPFNQSVQVRWFAAACAFAKQHHLEGLYYWGAWMSSDEGALPTSPMPTNPSYLQPAAQSAIHRCFA